MSSGPPSNEGSGGGDGDEGLGDCRELLIVAHEAPVLHDPGEGPFHHPPARDHGKARLTRGALDHLQVNMGPLLRGRLRSQGAGSRLRFGWARRCSMRRIMASLTMVSETSGSSSYS